MPCAWNISKYIRRREVSSLLNAVCLTCLNYNLRVIIQPRVAFPDEKIRMAYTPTVQPAEPRGKSLMK
jgi:hypothetical protein